jgi:superfamily I DNA/RNA helicase
MRIFADYGETLGQACDYAQHLFKQQGKLTLITGHKAKGLEWDTVYHLDPWIIKSGEQEDNLKYVISTRSKDTLYEIDSKEIK